MCGFLPGTIEFFVTGHSTPYHSGNFGTSSLAKQDSNKLGVIRALF